MTKFIKNNLPFLLPILSGVLLILAYPPYDLEFLIWIALIPLFWFLALKQTSPKNALIGGFLAGVLFFGKLFGWLFATYPFEWLGITTEMGTTLVFVFLIVLWIIQTVFLGLFFGIFAWGIKKMAKLSYANKKLSYAIFLIPSFWIILEYLRAWGFGVLWLGKESLLGPHWTIGNLAYTLHNASPLIQLADIIGIYGISFLIVFINIILFLILRQCWRPSLQHIKYKQVVILFIIFAVVVTIWNGYGIYKLNADVGGSTSNIGTKRVALLQTNFLSGSELNPYQKKEVFKTVLDLFRSPEATLAKPDIIIAPEGFGIVFLTGDSEIAKYLLKDFWQPGQIFLENQKIIDPVPDNTGVDEKGEIKSRLFYYDLEQEEPIAFHDKVLLVPNGGFLPYLTKFFLNIYSFDMGFGERFYKRGEKIEPAHLPAGKAGTPKGNIGGTICSSIVSPDINRKMTKKGAEVLIVVSSDAPFHGTKSLLTQNLAMSKLRAIENRRYFAQATNMGYSFLLNSKGEIVAPSGGIVKTSELGNEILFADVYLLNKKTIYTKFGDWFVILSTVIMLLTFILWYNKRSSL